MTTLDRALLTRLLILATQLLRDVGLVLAKELGVETDVARGVDTVDVARPVSDLMEHSRHDIPKAGGNREVRRDRAESLLTVPVSLMTV
jgi:predicted P-loop ATPase